jgi:hypothetical protein
MASSVNLLGWSSWSADVGRWPARLALACDSDGWLGHVLLAAESVLTKTENSDSWPLDW